MGFYENLPRPHERGLSDEFDEAYYDGARAAVDAVLARLRRFDYADGATSIDGRREVQERAVAYIESEFVDSAKNQRPGPAKPPAAHDAPENTPHTNRCPKS